MNLCRRLILLLPPLLFPLGCAEKKSVGATADLASATGSDLSVGSSDLPAGSPADLTAAPSDFTGVTLDLVPPPPDLLAPPDLTGAPPADMTTQTDLLSASMLPASDTFSGTALDGTWSIFNPGVVTVTVGDGKLHMQVGGGSLWYNTNQGPAVYKNVTGNFKVTSVVHAHRNGMGYAVPPTSDVHLAGLMARRDVPLGMGAQEDYVFLVVGYDVNDLSVEHKTTTDGVSTYDGPTWANGGEAELRICRIGTTFRLYKRPIPSAGGGAWTLATTYERNDLPATLQVGAVTYSSQASPDVTGSFDSIDFAPAANEADCTN